MCVEGIGTIFSSDGEIKGEYQEDMGGYFLYYQTITESDGKYTREFNSRYVIEIKYKDSK